VQRTVLLAIYLNDHFAGATAGMELARRAASSNRGTRYGPFLTELARDIEDDRQSLRALMAELDVGVDRVKVVGAWAAERIGRLKFNGRVRGYSPLSRLIELEGLALGVRGKLALWNTLRELEPHPRGLASVDIGTLCRRAESQLDGIEVQRLRAAAEAFGDG
jgi:hypothetical protein